MIVLGIRPDIINYQPIVRELEKRKRDTVIVHTGQHYSYFFDELFFKQLKFPKPDYHLKIGSGTQAQQLGKLVQKFEKVILKEKILQTLRLPISISLLCFNKSHPYDREYMILSQLCHLIASNNL